MLTPQDKKVATFSFQEVLKNAIEKKNPVVALDIEKVEGFPSTLTISYHFRDGSIDTRPVGHYVGKTFAPADVDELMKRIYSLIGAEEDKKGSYLNPWRSSKPSMVYKVFRLEVFPDHLHITPQNYADLLDALRPKNNASSYLRNGSHDAPSRG